MVRDTVLSFILYTLTKIRPFFGKKITRHHFVFMCKADPKAPVSAFHRLIPTESQRARKITEAVHKGQPLWQSRVEKGGK